jgi:hypothetical protein
MGEAFNEPQQRRIVLDALEGLATIRQPGTILEPGYRWRRHRFEGEAA